MRAAPVPGPDMNPMSCRVAPGANVDLAATPTLAQPTYRDRDEYERLLDADRRRIADRQDLLFADARHGLLVVLQGMDASGKDGIVRHVFRRVNPAGCHVTSFKRPSERELRHDFLWRTGAHLPERGTIGIFNRSWYEEVLVVRVHPHFVAAQNLPLDGPPHEAFWAQRYASIVEHEAHLVRNGFPVLKFFLHLSRGEQRRRFLDRIDEPDKNWKFTAADLAERGHWDAYTEAYERCLEATSTHAAPWFVIPADDKKMARLLVARVVADALDALPLRPPPLDEERRAALRAARVTLVAEDGDQGAAG
jgi:PPK2 family polyphosphate:nucleotide phosphotransferase